MFVMCLHFLSMTRITCFEGGIPLNAFNMHLDKQCYPVNKILTGPRLLKIQKDHIDWD